MKNSHIDIEALYTLLQGKLNPEEIVHIIEKLKTDKKLRSLLEKESGIEALLLDKQLLDKNTI